MSTSEIRFTDGAGYERYMGVWSRLVGETFLDWLAPASGQRWLDVGCGNGAFTQMIVDRCAPATVDGVDPSDAQLAFARSRVPAEVATFRLGDAMALPYEAASFDVAVMPLVIFFVPDPAAGVAEMARVVRPGGVVTAYAWDMPGGGFPYETLQAEMRALGVDVPVPPSRDVSRLEVLHDLWAAAGLQTIETRVISVHRTFASLDEYWTTIAAGPSVGPKLAAMTPDSLIELKRRLRERLSAGDGPFVCHARANAITGVVARGK